jgi:phosphoenolpyruvate carboxylase
MVDYTAAEDTYDKEVELKYQLYNSLFLTLPLDAVQQTGLLLPLLEEACNAGLDEGKSPRQIIEEFFAAHKPEFNEEQQTQFLFKVIQYVERQVVLIDALEDSAYESIHHTQESNRLRQLTEQVAVEGLQQQFAELLRTFAVRIVLTAHPTQFYPGQVLAIITDLTEAVSASDVDKVRDLLQQLGNTPFFNKEKPSPYEEAVELSWYLGNIFYETFSKIMEEIGKLQSLPDEDRSQLLNIGFWPGGDRDGNPFVTCTETRQVAEKLRFIVLECYRNELRQLKRRLSFKAVYEELEALEHRLQAELTGEIDQAFESVSEFQQALKKIETEVGDRYQGLYLDKLKSFQSRVSMFGFHFASLDIRQDSRVIQATLDQILESNSSVLPGDFYSLSESARWEQLLNIEEVINPASIDDPVQRDTLESLALIRDIQRRNGEKSCHRYVISNCRGPRDVINVIALSRLAGWDADDFSLDIVPLFETIDDLHRARESMESLYRVATYREHLRGRNNQQTVMLGFSDGTKDGGYLMANWAIYQAKEAITTVSRNQQVEVVFFDGRGGPPARGGGSTYKFYAALGKTIESNQIQLTVQGQTISSYYGTEVAAMHNLNQLLAAGLESNLFDRPERELTNDQRALIDQLATKSYEKYLSFKQDPLFLPYLEQMSTLHYYAQSNIGSRPAKRGSSTELKFEDLRAIPFVGAWGQLKQNVPGYYGLGSALKAMEDQGRLDECKALYKESKFFEALVGNSMQSMSKSIFKLTSYMRNDPEFGDFWLSIFKEYELSREMALKVSGQTVLLEDNPTSQCSIKLRMQIVLPLLVIQQYALMKVREAEIETQANASTSVYEKMIVRSLFGNINASRNSA